MKAFFQDEKGTALFEHEFNRSALDVITVVEGMGRGSEVTVYKRVYLRKMGDAVYRPATHERIFR